jgi:tRNA threonylcarbamoyladenosine biosynthesis protein TsaB
MKYTLSINTKETAVTIVTVVDSDGKRMEKRSSSATGKSQMVLPLIEELLSETKATWTDISNVEVATGPGSFTGLRVGTSIAATISWLLSVPINSKPPGSIPHLEYGVDTWKRV